MKQNIIKDWLEGEMKNYPDQKSGENLQHFMINQVAKTLPERRIELIDAIRDWINQRGTKTMFGVKLVETFDLSELMPELEQLLNDIRAGLIFKPWLAKDIQKTIEKLNTNAL